MAGLSRSIFTLLQVLTSSDLMETARLAGRDVLEIARYLSGDRPIILGGLIASATASGVSVGAGALIEPYAGVVSAPQADESTSVLGLQLEAQAVPVPSLGVATWYLIEARAAEKDTLGPVSVLNQTTKVIAPQTALVQRETSLLVRARVGTANQLPALAAGWQPLAAVLRQPSGPVIAGQVYDLRTLPSDVQPPGAEYFTRHDYSAQVLTVSPPATVQLDVGLVDRFGSRLTVLVPQLPLAAFLEPGYTPVSETWGYLYLCTAGDVAPRTALGRGVLVFSPKAPTAQGGRVPAAAITLPGPWAGLAAVRATCVGCLRIDDLSSGYQLLVQHCVGGRYLCDFGPRVTAVGPLSPPTGLTGPTIPRNARRALFRGTVAAGVSARGVTFESSAGGWQAVPIGIAAEDVSGEATISVVGIDNPASLTMSSSGSSPSVQLLGAEL